MFQGPPHGCSGRSAGGTEGWAPLPPQPSTRAMQARLCALGGCGLPGDCVWRGRAGCFPGRPPHREEHPPHWLGSHIRCHCLGPWQTQGQPWGSTVPSCDVAALSQDAQGQASLMLAPPQSDGLPDSKEEGGNCWDGHLRQLTLSGPSCSCSCSTASAVPVLAQRSAICIGKGSCLADLMYGAAAADWHASPDQTSGRRAGVRDPLHCGAGQVDPAGPGVPRRQHCVSQITQLWAQLPGS